MIHHADQNNIVTQPLPVALKQEFRGRFLNPEWLKGLMKHDYAGARTMGSEFLEYMWGWQVTNPDIIDDWMWEEVKAVYMDDKYQIKLDEFLQQGHNSHVKANMLAIMLVSIHKEFWQANAETIAELAEKFADLVSENGLPGSGHTTPSHPMLPWLEKHLPEEKWQDIKDLIEEPQSIEEGYTTISEIQMHEKQQQTSINMTLWWFVLGVVVIFVLGVMRQRRLMAQHLNTNSSAH